MELRKGVAGLKLAVSPQMRGDLSENLNCGRFAGNYIVV
ncbi:hypothetical protein PJE062_3983 [Pseudovibrio sp. JE062]|nr:hypothetical protein PJE062_3983 [Pseudovibrio sp. JE062]